MSIKVLGLSGSTRKGSFNTQFLGYVLERVKEHGGEVSTFDFAANPLPLYSHELEMEGYPEAVLKLKQAIADADAVIIASPEYNSSVTPMLKNFIDWASRTNPDRGTKNEWRHKPIAIIGASGGKYGGVRGLFHLRQILVELVADVLPEQAALSGAHEAYNQDGSLKDERTAGFVDAIAKRLITVAAALKEVK